MKWILGIFGLIAIIIIIGAFFLTGTYKRNSLMLPTASPVESMASLRDAPKVAVVADQLDTPWALAFLPDNSILITERAGTVRRVNANGQLESQPVASLPKVVEIGEGGLLGIALHPDFATNKYVYLYYTYDGSGENTLNRVVRMKYENGKLMNEEIILDKIPGASNHNGGRIKFGPDRLLYIGTGDAQQPSQAQNTKTLAGKVLRITDTGKPASDNPFGNEVFSYGHRNIQGLAWDAQNNLWETEHGRSGAASGLDELNSIEKGKNYGWPEIEGNETRSGMVTPRQNSGPTTTWAPSGAAFVGNSLFFSGLRGQALYEAVIENSQITTVKEHLKGEYGRIREVIVGPDGLLYITTSNRDGRGVPGERDDKVLRVNPTKLN